jgi:hypothetical protein
VSPRPDLGRRDERPAGCIGDPVGRHGVRHPEADTVTSRRVSLDRRVVATVRAPGAKFSRRCTRPGTRRRRVVGFDATGAKVVGARRSFRVSRGG